MRAFLLLLLLFLAGCGGDYDPASDNHGYGYSFDVQGASGLRLRFNPAEPVSQRTPVWVFENAWMDVQKCAGLTAPPPMVIVEGPVVDANGNYSGFYRSGPPLIVVGSLVSFRHEVIHYLLDQNTGNLDPAHNSPLFKKCEL